MPRRTLRDAAQENAALLQALEAERVYAQSLERKLLSSYDALVPRLLDENARLREAIQRYREGPSA